MYTRLFILITALIVVLSLEVKAGDFTDNGNGTVTDNITGLVWQQEDDSVEYDWKAAITYCEDSTLAGYDDWRLPNYEELRSLIDFDVYDPAIDKMFLNTKPSGYWTSTTSMSSTYSAWYVDFYYGYVYNYYKTFRYYVRCVRG
jgi:Protein of unknown function (DUF1566).